MPFVNPMPFPGGFRPNKAAGPQSRPTQRQTLRSNAEYSKMNMGESQSSKVGANSEANSAKTSTKMAMQNAFKKGRKFGSGDQSSSSSSSSEFSKPVERQYFFDESLSECIKFNYEPRSPLYSKSIERATSPTATTFVQNPKLSVSISTLRQNTNAGGLRSQEYTLISNDLYFRLSKQVVKDSRGPIINSWTVDNFRGYIDSIVGALEWYYAVDSVLAYSSSPNKSDRNDINIEWQERISTNFSIISNQNRLRRLLKGFAFPNKYSQMIRWLYQLYKVNNLDQAHNYRFVPRPELVWSTSGADLVTQMLPVYDEIFANLEIDSNRDVSALLCRSFPDWEIMGLPLSCNEATFDYTHYEMWINQPLIYATSEGTEVYPNTEILGSQLIPWQSPLPNGESSALPLAMLPTYTGDNWSEKNNTSGLLIPVKNTNETASSRQGQILFYSKPNNAFEPLTATDTNIQMESTGLMHRAHYEATVTGDVYSILNPTCELKYFTVAESGVVELRTLIEHLFDLK